MDGADRLVIPGLVNAHTHAAMTLLRHRADDLPFMAWLFGSILPMEDRLGPGDFYWGTMLAICEMLRSGATCFNDMYFGVDEVVRACAESGMRAVLSRGLLGDSAADPAGLDRLNGAAAEIKECSGAGNGRITFLLAPHAAYTCAPDYVQMIIGRAKELGVGIHTHISESRDENAQIAQKYSKTPFEYFESAGLFELPTVAAHCVHVTDSDIEIAAKYGVSVATNPVSNLKLANGAAPVKKLLAAGINVALGTDGAASNNSLNMIRELGYLCLVHKGFQEDAACVPAAQGLHIATLGGAKALGLGHLIGSIEPSKKADLAILNLNRSHFTPRSNLLAALCYGAQGSEVETVLVDGNILLEHGELTRIDEERVRWEAQRIAERICGGVS
jgi:5-methylthioadenosine/S-adenosylhomocysteine deaminase